MLTTQRSACWLVLLLLLGVAGPAAAQVRVGPIAAMSWTTLNVEEPDLLSYDTDRRWGGGVRCEVDLGPRLDLLAEPSVVERGALGTASEEGVTVSSNVVLRYFELPILVRYSFDLGKAHPYLAAGPTFAYLDSARVTTSLEGGSERADVTSELSRTDVGFSLGAGLFLTTGSARWFAEARYTEGLVNLDRSDETTVRNQSLSLLAGVTLRLGSNR